MKAELDMSVDDLKMLRAILAIRARSEQRADVRLVAQTASEQLDVQLYPPKPIGNSGFHEFGQR